MRQFLIFIFTLTPLLMWAQAPVINSITPVSAAPQQTVVITGSGFSATPSQLNVWFDHVKGNILSSSLYSILVQVPAQGRLSNVEVVNLSTNLSGKSGLKFQPGYGGNSFDATKTSLSFTNSDVTELFDVSSSDFDLDGKPDLLASKTTGTNTGVIATDLVIFQNQSSGIGNINFTKYNQSNLAVLNVSAATAKVASGDLNGDGKPDVVAARTGSNLNEVIILRNTNSTSGTLSFAAAQKVFLPANQAAARISIRDLNQDGKPELIVSNSFDDLNPATDNQIYIFPNQSTVSAIAFGAPIALSVTGASTSYGMEVQDMDGDGKADIVLVQYQTSNVFTFLNKSSGTITFGPAQKITASGNFNTLTSADLNNDGLLDLIATATLDNALQFFVNNSTSGNISFAAPVLLATSAGPWGVDASDIDGDGDVDMVVANRNEAKVNVFRQDAALSFTRLDIVTAKPCFNVRAGDYDGDGKPDIAVTSFSNPNFSLDVIRNANCISPSITSSSTVICSGQTIRLKTKPALGTTFTWSKDAVGVQSGTQEYYDATQPGTYTVLATGTFDTGCSVQSPQLVLTSNPSAPPADPSIINNFPCVGGVLNLSTTNVPGATYQWTGPNNFSSTIQSPVINPVTSSSVGIYSLQVTVGQCSSNVVTKELDAASVPVLPISASSALTSCAGSTNTLSVTNVGSYSYQWKNNGVAISGQTTYSLAATADGTYTVLVTDNSTTCSQETSGTTLSFYTAPNAAFSIPTADCQGTALTFTDQSTKDSRGTLNYAWDFGDTHTSTTQSPTNTYTNAGLFTVSLTVTYVGVAGCSSTATKPITITTPIAPSIAATVNPICQGQTSTLSFTGNFSGISWVGATGTTSSVVVTQPGSYSVNVTDSNGCSSTGSITVNASPTFALTVSADTTIKSGAVAKLTSSGADSYLWSPGKTLSDSTIAAPSAKPTTTTTYFVTGTKSGFCNARDSVKVTVLTGSKLINPPALFSPNGDHINDSWIIPDTDSYQECTMTIYDGHGSQVYQQKGYNSANYWDGTYNGKSVPDGTYFYVFGCPTSQVTTGSVLVVR